MSTSSYGFTFNGHHSSEFGLNVLANKAMTLPSKNKITVSVPYSSKVLDLSDIYGANVLGERTITFPCRVNIGYLHREELYTRWTEILDWLMSPTGKIKLIDDTMPDFYYLGEVQTAPTITENTTFADFSIVFQCDAYRYRHIDGSDLWDPFRFDLDIAQKTAFDVKGQGQAFLISQSLSNVQLNVTATAPFTLSLNNESFQIPAGITKNPDIVIQRGQNNIIMLGTGNISFDWYEGVI